MATADQVKALIQSHAEGDDTRFYSIAIQVAAQAARNGHGKLAQELRGLVDQARLKGGQGAKPIPALRLTSTGEPHPHPVPMRNALFPLPIDGEGARG